MIGLNTVFKQVFGEGLKEQGFVKVKGRHPYVVRVVEGGKIIHVISCRLHWCAELGHKAFEILGTVYNVYSDSTMDLSRSPTRNIGLLETMADIYAYTDKSIGKDDYYRSIFTFVYKPEDGDMLRGQMERALGEAKKVMVPVFDKTVNLRECIHYYQRYGFLSDTYSLYIKIDNHDDLTAERDSMIAEEIRAIQRGVLHRPLETVKERIEDWRQDTIAWRDNIFNDPVLYAQELDTMEKNRIRNEEALRACGVEI